MGCLSKKGQHPSTGPPTYQIIKVTNANHMSVMKTSLTIFPCVLGSAFPIIRVCSGLSFATKRIGPPCCTLFTFVTCCSLEIILSQNYLLPIISVLAENTLLKPLVISFCSSLGSTLLLIERGYNYPLHLWVIKTFFWHRCRGVIAWGEYSRVCLLALSLSNFYLLFLVVLYL